MEGERHGLISNFTTAFFAGTGANLLGLLFGKWLDGRAAVYQLPLLDRPFPSRPPTLIDHSGDRPQIRMGAALHWNARITRLIGREALFDDILAWALDPDAPILRLLHADGGVGKTRLAMEVARALEKRKWLAGALADPDPEKGYRVREFRRRDLPKGIFVVIDYPEAKPELAKALADLADRRGKRPLKILLLSRKPERFWRHRAIETSTAELSNAKALDDDGAYALFKAALRSYDRRLKALGLDLKLYPKSAFMAWLDADPRLHGRPLMILAAALRAILEDDFAVDLGASAILTELVERESDRLRKAGRAQGFPDPERVVDLLALASLAGPLDPSAQRRLADPALALDLPPQPDITRRLRDLGCLDDGDILPPFEPDQAAAMLVAARLYERAAIARPDALWAAIEDQPTKPLTERLERVLHDQSLLGQTDAASTIANRLLPAMIAGDGARATSLELIAEDARLAHHLAPLAIAIGKTLHEAAPDDAERARHLNNLSVHLANAGRGDEAIRAIECAVAIRERLARNNPDRFEPEWAQSLHNLSADLADAGRGDEAIRAIERAVAIRERLARDNPARFEPELARSLNNLSLRLADAGRGDKAIRAIERAVEIYERLARDNPARFEPELASSLNNLSLRLAAAGRGDEAIRAIERAVVIRERLARDNPTRFEPDLATSLAAQSCILFAQDHHAAAIDAIRRAIALLAPHFAANPRGHARLIGAMLGDYRRYAEAAGVAVDWGLAGPIVARLEGLREEGGGGA